MLRPPVCQTQQYAQVVRDGLETFAWIEKCRCFWKNCERKLNTSLPFIHLAFLALLLRKS